MNKFLKKSHDKFLKDSSKKCLLCEGSSEFGFGWHFDMWLLSEYSRKCAYVCTWESKNIFAGLLPMYSFVNLSKNSSRKSSRNFSRNFQEEFIRSFSKNYLKRVALELVHGSLREFSWVKEFFQGFSRNSFRDCFRNPYKYSLRHFGKKSKSEIVSYFLVALFLRDV